RWRYATSWPARGWPRTRLTHGAMRWQHEGSASASIGLSSGAPVAWRHVDREAAEDTERCRHREAPVAAPQQPPGLCHEGPPVASTAGGTMWALRGPRVDTNVDARRSLGPRLQRVKRATRRR